MLHSCKISKELNNGIADFFVSVCVCGFFFTCVFEILWWMSDIENNLDHLLSGVAIGCHLGTIPGFHS